MTRTKQFLSILSLFALLFAVVSVPAFLMEYQSSHSFHETVLYPVDGVQLGDHDGSLSMQELTVWERIKLINSSSMVVRSTEYTDLTPNADLQESQLYVMEEQLMLLQELAALPDLTFSNVVQSSFSKIIYYTDETTPELTLGVWEIYAEYPDFIVLACMDAEIFTLYDILIHSKVAHNPKDPRNLLYDYMVSEQGYYEYLLLFSEGSDDEANTIFVDSFYSVDTISLRALTQ